MPQDITPKQAHEMLSGGQGYIYLDVRSIEEFAMGRPPKAKNVPLLFLDRASGRLVPNPGFLAAVEAAFPKDAKLIVGCKAGGRSVRACQVLDSAGFRNLWNMDGGFVARTDPLGQVLQPGWSMLGLPVEYEDPKGPS